MASPIPTSKHEIGTGNTEGRAGKYLVFHLGREEFGIRVLKVREIMGIQDITLYRRRRLTSKVSSTFAGK
jgi:purine-binding chemotaxis protein CheW